MQIDFFMVVVDLFYCFVVYVRDLFVLIMGNRVYYYGFIGFIIGQNVIVRVYIMFIFYIYVVKFFIWCVGGCYVVFFVQEYSVCFVIGRVEVYLFIVFVYGVYVYIYVFFKFRCNWYQCNVFFFVDVWVKFYFLSEYEVKDFVFCFKQGNIGFVFKRVVSVGGVSYDVFFCVCVYECIVFK